MAEDEIKPRQSTLLEALGRAESVEVPTDNFLDDTRGMSSEEFSRAFEARCKSYSGFRAPLFKFSKFNWKFWKKVSNDD